MGTYTINYNLFMPTVGEQGWGDLVNGNFTTIDATMAGLNTRVGTLETDVDTVEEKVTVLEPLSVIQVDENQNVTFPANVNISGDISCNLNCTLNTDTNVIGGLYLNALNVTLLTATSATSKTLTYKSNPISNTVKFSVQCVDNGSTGNKNSGYVKVNGTNMISTTSSSLVYSDIITLNHGDTIVIGASGSKVNSSFPVYIKMYADGGYIVSP